MTNIERAESARACIDAFMITTGVETVQEAIGDLVANLCHYATEEGLDALSLLKTGIGHWLIEQIDEYSIDCLPDIRIIAKGLAL